MPLAPPNPGSPVDSATDPSPLAEEFGPAALDGVRVVEIAHAISGPQCAQILADHGADVVKVEPPRGEGARYALPWVGEDSVYFACHNRGKRSVCLDLKSADGLAALHKLATHADILITNYSAGVPDRNQWGWNTLRALNPEMIMVHITGFGVHSQDRELRAYDQIVQGLSGIAEYTGTPESGPVFVAAFVADHISAYQACLGTLFALLRRQRTGHGEFVDISMLHAYQASSAHAAATALAGEPFVRIGNKVSTAMTNSFEAADGYVVLAPLGEPKWRAFLEVIGRSDWIGEISYSSAIVEHRDTVDHAIAEWCALRPREEIVRLMNDAHIACGPILSVAEAARRTIERGSGELVSVTTPHGHQVLVPAPLVPVGLRQPAVNTTIPDLGEHTDQVLAEIGMSRDPQCPPAQCGVS